MIRDPQNFPEKNSPYFAYLLEHQIKKQSVPKSQEKPGWLGTCRQWSEEGFIVEAGLEKAQ